ncbi:thioesterase II family protein [Pseudovibrio denitrificans]|uniref:thioesterase II family protein n=1 Tax=Pseudovibrio denitrificans TaxID=258256 RepID=UPI0039BFACE9
MPSPWFDAEAHPNKLNLVCLPQAGGDTSLCNRWKALLGDQVNVMPAKFPGRGVRLGEPSINCMEEVVDQLAQEIRQFGEVPFALLGSSMGGWIAYELAICLAKQHHLKPTALFVLASASPFAPRNLPFLEGCTREEMIEELILFNPDFKQIAEHDELVSLLLPAIISDFKLCETYRPRAPWKVKSPIFAFAGREDQIVERSKVEEWTTLSSETVVIDDVEGGHFFIEERPTKVLDQIREHAANVVHQMSQPATLQLA